MSSGVEGLKDFETFAKAEEERAKAFAKAQNNQAQNYWYADADLAFKRESMHAFFESLAPLVSCGEVTANKRAADTVAAFDRAYKFRRQARLDNVPRQTCVVNMDVYYWGMIADALKVLAKETAAGA